MSVVPFKLTIIEIDFFKKLEYYKLVSFFPDPEYVCKLILIKMWVISLLVFSSEDSNTNSSCTQLYANFSLSFKISANELRERCCLLSDNILYDLPLVCLFWSVLILKCRSIHLGHPLHLLYLRLGPLYSVIINHKKDIDQRKINTSSLFNIHLMVRR